MLYITFPVLQFYRSFIACKFSQELTSYVLIRRKLYNIIKRYKAKVGQPKINHLLGSESAES